MGTGASGLGGHRVHCPVVEAHGLGIDVVTPQVHSMGDCSVWADRIRGTTVTMSPVLVSSHVKKVKLLKPLNEQYFT